MDGPGLEPTSAAGRIEAPQRRMFDKPGALRFNPIPPTNLFGNTPFLEFACVF